MESLLRYGCSKTISVSSLPLTLEISLISEPHVSSHAFIRSDAITKNLSELSHREYSISGPIETATLAGIVHGVVVQIIKAHS